MITINNITFDSLKFNDRYTIIKDIASLLCSENHAEFYDCLLFFKRWFENEVPGDKHTFLALDDDKLVGVVRLWSTPYLGGKWYVEGLEVSPSYRRKGIGSKLLIASIEFLKHNGVYALWSNIRNSNEASIKLHESLGFKLVSNGACNTYGSYLPHNNCYCIDTLSNSQVMSHIRPYEEKDFEKVLELYKEVNWPTFYTRLDDARNSFSNSTVSFVYEIDNELVGFIRGLTDCHITLFIPELLVKEAFRGKGIGTALLDMCHKVYPTCRIELMADDAANFYRKLGFDQEFIGMRKRF